jgi:hypothetical protein
VGSIGGVFVPVEGVTGDHITAAAQAYVCRFPADGIVVGDADIITHATVVLFDQLLRGDAPPCHP